MNRATDTGRLNRGAAFNLGSVANRARIMAKDLSEARERRRLIAAGPSLAERQAELITFYDRYEKYVEMLCDAAQHGPSERLEAAYEEDGRWFATNYASLGLYVSAFLAPEETDAFERLFSAPDLSSFLARDDGSVIFLITSTREALSLYAEHLRQLAVRKAA